MTKIDAGAPVITLINMFTVPPQRQRELIDLLDRATVEVMSKQPGFVSANIHRGLDGGTVANYAQWRSRADFEAMLADPRCQEHMAAASAIAGYAPALYEVASVHGLS